MKRCKQYDCTLAEEVVRLGMALFFILAAGAAALGNFAHIQF